MIWYYANEGQRTGPIDQAEFEALIETGIITANTLVWNETFSKWKRYADLASPAQGGIAMPVAAATASCCECGQQFNQDDMLHIRGSWVCAACKPRFVQKIREGVSLPGEMEYGGFWIRFLAKLLDGLIQMTVIVIIFIGLGFLLYSGIETERDVFPWLGITPFFFNGLQLLFVVLGAAYTTFFLGRYGATPGKMICRLKVVTADGEKITYSRALGRHFAEMLNSFTFYIGYIIAAFDKEKRALHDHICTTRVVKRS